MEVAVLKKLQGENNHFTADRTLPGVTAAPSPSAVTSGSTPNASTPGRCPADGRGARGPR